jgi:hypothetical protein
MRVTAPASSRFQRFGEADDVGLTAEHREKPLGGVLFARCLS